MQWKTDSVRASNSCQCQITSVIPLEEGDDKDDGANYGGQDLVRVLKGNRHAETAETIWHGAPMLFQQCVDPMVGQWCHIVSAVSACMFPFSTRTKSCPP